MSRARSRRTPQRAVRSLLAGALVFLLACLGAGATAVPAQAAAGTLVASEPGTSAQLDDAPGWVTLAFSSGTIDKKVAKIIVTDAQGHNVTSGPLIVESTNVTTQLEDLDKGTYTVHYRVNGSDGQPRGGAFQFSYGQGSFSDQPDKSWSGTAQEPQILRGDQPNGPEVSDPPATETPGVEVTSTQTSEADPTTDEPRTTQDPDDPDQTDTGDPTDTEDPSGSASDPSASGTATATSSGPNLPFLIGGIVLLLGVGGAGYGLYRTSRRGEHS